MNLLNKLRYVPKRLGVVAAIVVAAAVPAALLAWGPDRPTYTVANPADRITFNSITDNPNVGDERYFVAVKDASNTAAGGWVDSAQVQPGKEYLVRIYVHNNAASSLNLTATNTRVTAALPTTTGKRVDISGFISADNAQPQKVWDDASFTSANDFNIAYVPGSAMIYNNVTGQAGRPVSDSIVNGGGAQIGYNSNDGNIPGCFQYAAYVTFKIKPQFAESADFTLTKDVRKSGTTTYGQTAAVAPGDKVDYRLSFRNTGAAELKNVVIKDQLPAGITYVPGTAKLQNANYQFPNTFSLTDDLFKGGVNIGHYTTNANAFVTFQGQVAGNAQLPTCGPNTLKNIASVETDAGGKSDDADVTVPKECVAEAKYVCKDLAVEQISRTQFRFTASRTVENAEYVTTRFIIRDANGSEITRVNDADGVYTYSRTQTGRYSVEAQIIVKVGGVEKVATSENCKKPFEVKDEPAKPVYECVSLELIKKSRDSFEFKTTARAQGAATIKEVTVDFGDNQKQTVDYGTNATHTYAKAGSYTAVATVLFTVDGKNVQKTSDTCKVTVVVDQPPVAEECKPGIPVNDARCEETPVTPETPQVLPSTGPVTILGGLFGSSALGLGITSYVRSRRALRDALNS